MYHCKRDLKRKTKKGLFDLCQCIFPLHTLRHTQRRRKYDPTICAVNEKKSKVGTCEGDFKSFWRVIHNVKKC